MTNSLFSFAKETSLVLSRIIFINPERFPASSIIGEVKVRSSKYGSSKDRSTTCGYFPAGERVIMDGASDGKITWAKRLSAGFSASFGSTRVPRNSAAEILKTLSAAGLKNIRVKF